ncbi:MAG: hypothetical protein M3093_00905 [Thermoproteota archaeon]|nr:hypothetical protein [Thermoproteota archaeon]
MNTAANNHNDLADSFRNGEKTEVIYGQDNVTNIALQILSTTNKTLDLCGDQYGPSIILANDQITQKFIELHNRGVRQRFITEITYENIKHCKRLMKFQELRHLDGLKGYLSITDGRLFTSHAYGQEYGPLPHIVISTVRVLVEQQQYFFETLWNKAIPAKQRIKEIEEGAKREFVETIRDPVKIQEIIFDLIKKAEDEILILFSTLNTFYRQEEAGILALLKEATSLPYNVRIRILMPADDKVDRIEEKKEKEAVATTTATTAVNETIKQFKGLGMDIRIIGRQQQQQDKQNILQNDDNNLLLLIVDQSFSLAVELNEYSRDAKEESTMEEDAMILATHSNSDSTVFAYTSIFENLWMRAQEAQQISKLG